MPASLLSMLKHLFLSSSLSVSYFILAVPMRKCLGKHSCMSSSFPIVTLNDTSFFQQCSYKCTKENSVRDGDTSQCSSNPVSTKLNCFFILFHYRRFHALVFGKTLVHELPISYSHTGWYFPFSDSATSQLHVHQVEFSKRWRY